MIFKKPPSWELEEWVEAQKKIKQLSIKKNFHWKAYDYCSSRDRYLNLPIIILTSLVSTTAISQAASDDNNDNMNYVISAVSLLVTGLTSVSKYFNYAEAKEAHRQAALNYLRLRSELAELLSTAHIESEKQIPVTFAEFSKIYYNKFISVRENSPTLPSFIRTNMETDIKKDCETLKEKVRKANLTPSMIIDVEQNRKVNLNTNSENYVLDINDEYNNKKSINNTDV